MSSGASPVIFDYPEDGEFFRTLLCGAQEPFGRYEVLFDFREPTLKRSEFNAKRPGLLTQLQKTHGTVCMLQLSKACTSGSGTLSIDHLIPLSSNKLNKELRQLVALPGKKVASQSLGSNHPANLVLACGPCNGAKKHRLLPAANLRRLLTLNSKFF